MRIGDLVEHQQHGRLRSIGQQVVEPDLLERLDLDDHALVWRVARHKPAEIGDIRQGDGKILGKLHESRRVARRPRLGYLALGIIERGGDRMTAPEARPVRRSVLLVGFLAARHPAPMRARRALRNSI